MHRCIAEPARYTPAIADPAGPALQRLQQAAHCRHRSSRENSGHGLQGICEALQRLAQRQDVEAAWPLHPIPDVKRVVLSRLNSTPNISLLPPLDYPDFIDLLAGSDLTLTDSGGVQEEAPSLGKPALVLRESTERPDAIEAGGSILVGCEATKIVAAAERLLRRPGRTALEVAHP